MKPKISRITAILMLLLIGIVAQDVCCQNQVITYPRRRQQQTTRQTTTATPTTQQFYEKDLGIGEKLFDEEKYDEARKHFMKMLAKYPKYEADINRWITVCDTFIKEQEEELEIQRQNRINAYNAAMRTGEILIEAREYEQAVSHFQSMLSEYSEYASEINDKIEVCEESMKFNDKIITVNGVSFKMVAVKGGSFTMGATSEQGSDAYGDETPTHRVTLSDYYIGETEVTQELWQAVMGSNPSYMKGNNLPVEQVSWNDCKEFIMKLNSLTGKNFRLPTEAEWEYAARGGNRSQGYKYSGSNNIEQVAWYEGNSGKEPHPVKQKQANELGIYDMSGNVYEWCEDWFGDYSSSSQTNPMGPSTGSRRVLRGGSWDRSARCCRVSNRNYGNPGRRSNIRGFRLSLSAY